MARSVLIIDSDTLSAKLARTVLEADGWRVMCSPDSEHARHVVGYERPDLIITELILPEPAALELIRALKATARDVPIVAVTSRYGPETEFRVLEAGCTGFIRKPIDVSTFSVQLLLLLGDHHDPRPARR